MLKRKTIRFIVNPFSGVGKKNKIDQQIQKNLDHKQFQYDILFTQHAGHATELAKAAVKENIDIVVAVGGDGSVNEVAAALIGTKTILGILPAGSGNGFAMHLGLGRNIEKAIRLINTCEVIKIDSCRLNDRPYINLAGVGFDAWVAYKLKQSSFRGFLAYLKFTLQEVFSFKPRNYQLNIDGQNITKKCLVVEVANAPMFGYNFQIAPHAKFNDGLLEVVIIKAAPKWRYLFSAWRFLNGSIHKSSLTECYTVKQISISSDQEMATHMDGEGFLSSQKLDFSIVPLSLNLLAPKKHQ